MVLFPSLRAQVPRLYSTSPPSYNTTLPPKYEAVTETKECVDEPLIEVAIHVETFKIPIRILEQKAPKFLQMRRKSESLVSYVHESTLGNSTTRLMPEIFAHWLRHDKLPSYDLLKLSKKEPDQSQALIPLTGLIYLFCIAEQFEITKLMDTIMDTISITKWRFELNAACTRSIYNRTSGACGMRLFAIRNLVYRIYNYSTQQILKPSDFEALSTSPDIMKEIFAELAAQGFAAAIPKHPVDYPACSYHHKRFAAAK